jgi:hypothetical protein
MRSFGSRTQNQRSIKSSTTKDEFMDVLEIDREIATLSDRLGKTQDYL